MGLLGLIRNIFDRLLERGRAGCGGSAAAAAAAAAAAVVAAAATADSQSVSLPLTDCDWHRDCQ